MAHKQWLDSLDLDRRTIYDRAYGKAWYAGRPDSECRDAGKNAVEKREKIYEQT